jgi:hypothetical protein
VTFLAHFGSLIVTLVHLKIQGVILKSDVSSGGFFIFFQKKKKKKTLFWEVRERLTQFVVCEGR